MRILFLIPARGGSKGLPNKNSKLLKDKPLILHTTDLLKEKFVGHDIQICVSSDSESIIQLVENSGINVPFVRPAAYAQDDSSSESVMLHALHFYQEKGINFELLVLLQPTSPLKSRKQIEEAISQFTPEMDMVVSVKKSKSNPYFNLFEEQHDGFLRKSKEGNFTRRQDCPTIYEYNGAIYVINVQSLLQKGFSNFSKIVKYEMDNVSSLDIDNLEDFELAEKFLN